MPIKIQIRDSKFSTQLRGYSDDTTTLKANISEYVQATYLIELFWYSEPLSLQFFDNGKRIVRTDGRSFSSDGISIGDNIQVQFGYTGNDLRKNFNCNVTGISEDSFTLFTDANELDLNGYETQSDSQPLITGLTVLENLSYEFGLIENDENFNTESKLTFENQKYNVENIPLNSQIDGVQSGVFKGWDSSFGFLKVERKDSTPLPIIRGLDFGSVGGTVPQSAVLNYELVQLFPLLPYFVAGEFSNLQNGIPPSFLEGNNSLKHVFNCEFKQSVSSQEGNKSIRLENLLGSAGNFGENFNGLQTQYSIDSISYQSQLTTESNDSLFVDEITEVEVIVLSANGTFTGAKNVVVSHSYLPIDEEEYQNSTNYFEENFIFESVSKGFSGAIIKNVTTTLLTANSLRVNFDIDLSTTSIQLTEESQYLLSICIDDTSSSAENSDRTNLIIDLNNYDKSPDVKDLLFVEEEKLFSWIDDTNGGGFDDFQGYIEDSILSKFEFKLDRATKGAVLENFSYKIVAWKTSDNSYFEIQSIPFNFSNQVISDNGDQLINIDISRGLSVGDNVFNTLKLETEGTRTGDFRHYTGQVSTKIDWQEWLNLKGADSIFYDDNEPNNGLNKNSSRYSLQQGYELKGLLFFEVGQESNDFTTEYIHKHTIISNNYDISSGEIWTCEGFETRKASDNQDLNGNIISTEGVIIKAKFQPSGFIPDPLEYAGVIRIEPTLSQGINQIYQIGSNRPVDAGYPLIPLDGDTFASLTWDGTFLNIECQTNNNFFDIASILPPKLSSRLWKTSEPVTICEIIFQTDIDNTTVIQGTVSVGSGSGWIYKGVSIVLGDVLNQAIATADGTTQDLTYFTDDCDSIVNVVASGNEFIGNLDLTELIALENYEALDTRQTALILSTGNTNPITNFDIRRSDFISLDLTGVNIGGSFKVAASTQISPIAPLNSLILPLNNNNVWTNFEVINSSLTSLDLSQQNNLGGQLVVLVNSLLNNLVLGSSNETFTRIQIDSNSLLVGNLDLSGYPNVLNLDIENNNYTSISFANATSLINGIDGDNNNITSLDFTPLGNNFSGVIRFENNNLSSLTFPVNSQAITRLDFTGNQLSTLDVSMLTGLQGTIHLDNNNFTSQANFNFGTITNVITEFKANNNNIAGVWDFTNFVNVDVLSNSININQNAITQVIFQNSINTISFNSFSNNSINTVLDLSPLTGTAGELDFQNNQIPSVILPVSSNVITKFRFNNNNIVNFDVTPLTGSNNNINPLRLNSNDMTTASMDQLISDLVAKGWTNGNLFLNSQSTGQLPNTLAADYITLDTVLNWTITI